MMSVMKRIITIAVALICAATMSSRVKTTRKNLQSSLATSVVAPEELCDSDSCDHSAKFVANAVTIRGYSKRLSDSDETFFVTNNIESRLGHITLTLLYTDVDGKMLHKRTETVNCDIKKGESRMIKIRSFDRHRRFYYYLGPRPRKSATPYLVKMHVEGYEIVVNNENNNRKDIM